MIKEKKTIKIILGICIIAASISGGILYTSSATATTATKSTNLSEISGALDTIGSYSPDNPRVKDPMEVYELELLKENGIEIEENDFGTAEAMAKIPAADLQYIESLKTDYEQLTLKEFRQKLETAALEKGSTVMESIAHLGYIAMYNPDIILDDFYTSLEFSLTEYYINSGIEQLADCDYTFIYMRYMDDKDIAVNPFLYDVSKELVFSYDLGIVYFDENTITVKERNDWIKVLISSINSELDLLSYEEWTAEGMDIQISQMIEKKLKEASNEKIVFTLNSISGNLFPIENEG